MATTSSSIADYLSRNPSEKPVEGPVRVCVGGGAGFIGSHIAKNLMEQVSDITTMGGWEGGLREILPSMWEI